MSAFLKNLTALLGPPYCLTSEAEIKPYCQDWGHSKTGQALAVVLPQNTEQVAAIVKLCRDHKIGIVPQGGNTGSAYGALGFSATGEIILSLKRMSKIRAQDPLNFTLIAEAGCSLRQVQEAALEIGRVFPLSLPSEKDCLIGGNIATNAGGTAVVRYGNIRDLVLGLEVVLPSGEVWHGLRQLRKNNTGYDLKHLFIGSEGSLGIITAAVLKLVQPVPYRAMAMVAVPTPQSAVELFAHVKSDRGNAILTFELMPRLGIELVFDHYHGTRDLLDKVYDHYVLIEVATARRDQGFRENFIHCLDKARDQNLILDYALAQNEQEAESLFLKLRNGMSDSINQTGRHIKHDVSVPLSKIGELITRGSEIVKSILPTTRLVPFGHVGDGNIHFNLLQPQDMPPESFMKFKDQFNEAIYALTEELGGSIAAEHGVGQMKQQRLLTHKSTIEMDMMKAIKKALDPDNIMNPGKVVIAD